jgi:NTE family protein
MTKRTPFERIALLLQGGGALGAYQAGVYQALAEADLHPDWVAGISIGAINSAIIAGNPPELRVQRLREFWETVSASPFGIPNLPPLEVRGELNHQLINQAHAMNVLMFGANDFFVPRVPPPLLWLPGSADKASYYDNTPAWETLGRLIDFDRINGGHSGCALRLRISSASFRRTCARAMTLSCSRKSPTIRFATSCT